MSDSVEFHLVPFGDENQAEVLFREYVDQLLASLDSGRVRSSCARERALLQIVFGALGATGSISAGGRVQREEVFGSFAEAFGWLAGEAELLKLWMGLDPSFRNALSTADMEAQIEESHELLTSDPYSRHDKLWNRCREHGYDSFMGFWGHRHADQFAATVALIDEAAKLLGDE